jgi:di/tricarboxylate transporter
MTAQRDSLHEASQVLIGRLGHTVEQQIEKLNTLVQQEYERRAQVIINRIALVIIALLVVIYFHSRDKPAQDERAISGKQSGKPATEAEKIKAREREAFVKACAIALVVWSVAVVAAITSSGQ